MQTRRRITLLSLVCAAVVAIVLAAFLVYDHLYGIPSGPALPPSPPDREYSKEVIDLNNKAVEIGFDNPEEALGLLDKAIEADPQYHMAYANKAVLFVRHKRYEEATRCYEILTRLQPRVPEYYVGHAICAHQLGDGERARDRLMHALSAYNYELEQKQSEWRRLNRALVLFLLKREKSGHSELAELQNSSVLAISEAAACLLNEMEQLGQEDRWKIVGPD